MTPRLIIWLSGVAYLTAMVTLVWTRTPLGTATFFACVAVAVAAFAAVLRLAWASQPPAQSLLWVAIVFAIAFRIPLALPAVQNDNDMIRYVWDGRVQKLGINPYSVRPADPRLAFTHTDETRDMPSARQQTPYPPAAQLFFRSVVTIHDSARTMKLALVLCELLAILVLWRFLLVTGRNPWLTLAYAWNPLVVLEAAHSGHIDTLGALWILGSVFWLVRGRSTLATVAFVLAVATKVLPLVLAPLFWRRITRRDALAGLALLVLLYLPFASAGSNVIVGLQNVVQHIRFNGPLFRELAALTSPELAARLAVLFGLITAAWCRWKLRADDPAAWAWPMAVAIAFAPVIYPWYLFYLTPFLLTPRQLPLVVWSCTALMTYVVWDIARAGGRWVVPGPILWLEYGSVALAAAWMLWRGGPAEMADRSG